MTPQQYSRRDEQIDAGQGPYIVDPTPLVGHWINTNTATTGIARVTIAREGGDVRITLWPVGRNGTPHRATADVVYATGPAATTAMALAARYEDEDIATSLEANLSLGLLVIATCHTFKPVTSAGVGRDNGQGANYFSREFFHYAGPPATA
jgi:hypothetical protein